MYNTRLELTFVKANGNLYNGKAGSQTYAQGNGNPADPNTNPNGDTLGDEAVTLDLAFGL